MPDAATCRERLLHPETGSGRGTSQSPLLVFADDWGRHPSSCQYLVRQLLDRHAVHWVNTIGMRTPRLDRATLRRAAEKLGQWLRPSPRKTDELANPRVHSPRMWPWFGSGFARGLNRRLLLRQLGPVVNALPEAPVAVTTLPIVADLMGTLPVRRWVYYCVDDFGQWPGLDQKTLQRMEEQVVARADVVLAVSETLQERLSRMGRAPHLLTHGVDLEFWGQRPPESPDGLDGLERPLVAFWGLLDRRMDPAFIRRLAEDMERGSIVLVGPESDPDPALSGVRRVVRLGPLPFEMLPQVAREVDVLVMPYADLPVTRAMQPLKLKEYLATGKPVVARDLPAARAWADCLDLCGSAESFSAAVRARLRDGLPEAQRAARGRLVEESWAGKARAFSRWALGDSN
jgi:glycosyltransferase involved in cell wall biosynthesis